MGNISQFAKESSYTILEEDIYSGTITSAEVDLDEKGAPKLDKYLKSRIVIRVAVDNQFDDDGKAVTIRRSLPISYGKNSQTGKWADLSNLITIVSGIAQGAQAQKEVETEEFVGKRLRFKTVNVEKDGNVYTNIELFMAMAKDQTRSGLPAGNAQGLARSQSAAARNLPPDPVSTSHQYSQDDFDDSEIPF